MASQTYVALVKYVITEYTSANGTEEVLLRNVLGGRTGVEGADDGVERDTSAGDTYDAVCVGVNGYPLDGLGRVHVRLLLRLYGPAPDRPSESVEASRRPCTPVSAGV
jgi:hypothetical protein